MGIYLIQADKNGPIKIGYSGDPLKRASSTQTHNHVELVLLAVIPDGDRKLEKALHQQFGDLHLKGEWFNPGPELLKYISSLGTPPKRVEKKKFTLGANEKAIKIWFDLDVQTDIEAARRIGRNVSTIRIHLGPSGRDRSRAGAIAAKASPVTKPKAGRMPLPEAAVVLKDERYGRMEALAMVNKLSRQRGYKVPWTSSYLQDQVAAKRITLPVRKSGPKPKL